MKTAITLQHIGKVFKDYRGRRLAALQGIDMAISEGEFFVIVGPSGCGKSTLLRIMSGLEKKFSGTQSYAPGVTKERFGFVFQQFALLPWRTVKENISLGLLGRDRNDEEDQKRVTQLLKFFGLGAFAHERPRELSGGMKQRVGIARALAIEPQVVFLDEPFSALDSFTAAKLREELLSLWQEKKMTVVMVTHNIEEAVQLADRIAVMSSRPGRIVKVVGNSLPRPRGLRDREFFALVDHITELVRTDE